MARKAGTVEYLERLVGWAGGRTSFLRLTGISPPNLTSYLNGSKNITWDRLRKAASHVYGEPPAFIPIFEGYDLASGLPTLDEIGKVPGIYAFFDSAMKVIYFGKAASLYEEVRQTLKRKVAEVRPWTGAKDLTFREITRYCSAYEIARSDASFRHDVEALGLRIMVNNTFNKNGATFKRSV